MSEQELRDSLDHLAHALAEGDTASHRAVLDTLAMAIRDIAPGIADALIDSGGSEVMRLRAFGLAHGVVLHDLDDVARTRLAMHVSSDVTNSLSAPISREVRAGTIRPATRMDTVVVC